MSKLVAEPTTGKEVQHLVNQIRDLLDTQEVSRATALASLLTVAMLIIDPHATGATLGKGIREASQFITLMLAGYNHERVKTVVH